MDLHPTPFPGKRRSVVTSIDAKNDKVTKRPPWQPHTAAAAQIRPKRTFGVVRSSNIPIDKPHSKPLLAKINKPYKESKTCKAPVPSAVPVKSSKSTEKSADTGRGIGRLKVASKNNQHVSFQELKAEASRSPGSPEKVKKDFSACTPAPLKKTVAVETPYHSARDCSNCRLDKLESSTYWLTQIRLAESVGNHFVSAAFFRLALDCRAQPFQRLQSELKSYVARHQASSLEPVWADIRKAYSLPAADLFKEEKKNTLLVEFNESVSEALQEFCKLDLLDASLIQEKDPSQGFHDELLSSDARDEECFLCHNLQDPNIDGLKNISTVSDTSSDQIKNPQEEKVSEDKAQTHKSPSIATSKNIVLLACSTEISSEGWQPNAGRSTKVSDNRQKSCANVKTSSSGSDGKKQISGKLMKSKGSTVDSSAEHSEKKSNVKKSAAYLGK